MGPRGQTTSLQLDQLKTPLAQRRIESGGAARHSALLLHSDSKGFTSSPTSVDSPDTAKASCAQTIPDSRTL